MRRRPSSKLFAARVPPRERSSRAWVGGLLAAETRSVGWQHMIRLILTFTLVISQVACGAIQEEIEAGAEFGATHDLDACLSEALARLDSCDSPGCEVLVPGFARACAEAAEYSASFCNNVSGSIRQAASWIHSRCKLRANPKACYKVHQQAVKPCIQAGA